jgi:hypothetical protein
MVKKTFIAHIKDILFLTIMVYLLIGCASRSSTPKTYNINETATILGPEFVYSATPTPTTQILPSRTLDLYRPDIVRATYAAEATQKAGVPASTPRPSSTPTLSPQQLCQPFPDNIRYLGSTDTLGYPAWTFQADCRGEKTYLRSPVGDMALFHYTALTGRFAYGSSDPNQSGLWVYDYWIELSEKWLDHQVIKAEWSPAKDIEGKQILAVLEEDGTLLVLSGPFQSKEIGKNVDFFSFSPTGDQIAYVKDEILYVVSIPDGQPRKLAEQVYGTPQWALEQNAIICPSSPIQIAKLDGSGLIIPEEMGYITKWVNHTEKGMQVLWGSDMRLLVFYTNDDLILSEVRVLHIYELSEDLHTIINNQFILGEFDAPFAWHIPGTSVMDASGTEISILPPDVLFNVEGRITAIEENTLGVELVGVSDSISRQFSTVTIDNQTCIYDKNGNNAFFGTLQKGMIITLTARPLHTNTLSLYAYRISILCDDKICYLSAEGRS